jgi:hypothetical protein
VALDDLEQLPSEHGQRPVAGQFDELLVEAGGVHGVHGRVVNVALVLPVPAPELRTSSRE